MLERRKERNRQSAAKCREKQKLLEIHLQTVSFKTFFQKLTSKRASPEFNH